MSITADSTLTSALDAAGIRYEILDHPPTRSALEEATTLGVRPQEVAKTLVLATPDGYVRAVVPASERLSLRKVKDVLGVRDAHLVPEPELVGAYPQFELGAVPPFGGPDDLVIVDPRLCGCDTVVLEAGTHERSLRLRCEDLLQLANSRIDEICED